VDWVTERVPWLRESSRYWWWVTERGDLRPNLSQAVVNTIEEVETTIYVLEMDNCLLKVFEGCC
jgi:hypothetical protein